VYGAGVVAALGTVRRAMTRESRINIVVNMPTCRYKHHQQPHHDRHDIIIIIIIFFVVVVNIAGSTSS
jgi:hypothetical protein